MTTPADWERIRALFHRALERPPDERARFVREHSASDEALRREVESLLAAHRQAEGVPDAPGRVPPLDDDHDSRAATPRLATGARLGAFEIVRPIGAGGMGQVYQARDTRLDRMVAIKVLAPDLAGDPAFRTRFEREAKAIAALNHPHICRLYDIGRQDHIEYLVLELVEGETLAARLGRGPLLLGQMLGLGVQIAEALEAAHRQGIVHRDLKPGNVMLTPGGTKLLDFGLAKRTLIGAAGHALTQVETSPPTATAPGIVVGTLQYMAPEQVQGQPADVRTDIFALGGILYEMTTGRRAFAGGSPASLIASILEHEPPPLSAAQAVPAGVERLIRKCLAKDPNARWQSASDVADELRWLASGAGSGPLVGAAPPGAPQRARPWGVAAGVTALVALGAIGSLGLWLRTRDQGTTAPPPVAVHTQVTFAQDVRAAALSPDGRTVAFATGPHGGPIRIMARDLAGGHAVELWRGVDVFKLQWLPDASSVIASGATAPLQRGVWVIPRLGGAARRLPEYHRAFALSPDGSQLALSGPGNPGFSILKTDGSVVRRVRLTGTQRFAGIEWSAIADQVVLLTHSDEDGSSTVISATPDGSARRPVYQDPLFLSAVCSSPVADALYLWRSREGTYDLLRLRLTGQGQPDVRVLLTGLPVFHVPNTSSQPCSVSADGSRLVYMRGSTRSSLWRLDLRRSPAGATPLSLDTPPLSELALSPDGQTLVAGRGNEYSTAEIVRFSPNGGDVVRLGNGWSPAWSPDGTRIAFISSRSGPFRVWVSDLDGHHASEIKDSAAQGYGDVAWLPDGRIAWAVPGLKNYRIHDPASGRQEFLMKESNAAFVSYPRFSPRGDQVALFINRGSQIQRGLWLLSWPAREERFIAEGLTPMAWSVDGESIYASGRDRSVFRVSARTGKTELLGSAPAGSLEGAPCTISVSAGVAVCPMTELSQDAWMVEHFDPDVRARVPR